MMRAVWFEKQGPAHEVLIVGERPTPKPKRGQARVRLAASGVNPADANRRAGRGWPMAFPLVIANSDGAGTVDAVGEGVDPTWVGRRVWLHNGQRGGRAFGTAAEFIALDARLLAPLPEAVSFAEGATLGIPCMTAERCVFMDGPVYGKTVLVTGGAGAVGHYAVQLATWAGARVFATVSSEIKAKHALAAGAEAVIDYKREDVVARVKDLTAGRGVDRIVEVDFGGNLDASLQMLRPGGTIAAYATRGNESPVLPFGAVMRGNLSLRGILLGALPLAERREAQATIGRWLAGGRRLHAVASVHALGETAAAHIAVEAGTKLGTVVVDCTR